MNFYFIDLKFLCNSIETHFSILAFNYLILLSIVLLMLFIRYECFVKPNYENEEQEFKEGPIIQIEEPVPEIFSQMTKRCDFFLYFLVLFYVFLVVTHIFPKPSVLEMDFSRFFPALDQSWIRGLYSLENIAFFLPILFYVRINGKHIVFIP